MKVAIPYIDQIIDTDNGKVNTLVIENQKLFGTIVEDVYKQITGDEGQVVISENNKPCNVAKKVEVLSQFVPFNINTRPIITLLNSELERISLTDEYYENSMKMLSKLEKYVYDLCNELPFDVSITKKNVSILIKAVGAEIRNDYCSIAEKVIEYMDLIRTLEKMEKLYVLVNYRSYITDDEFRLFSDTVLSHGFHILLLESSSRERLLTEQRITIDNDLCEI